jgi:hypothetical protein
MLSHVSPFFAVYSVIAITSGQNLYTASSGSP